MAFPHAVLGVGEGARLFATALRRGGAEVGLADLSGAYRFGREVSYDLGQDRAGPVITHLNPPEMLWWTARGGQRPYAGRRHIGYWAWELAEPPLDWRPAFRWVDEVWAPSGFTAGAIRAIAPPGFPVSVVPYPIFVLERPEPDRARFGLELETVVWLAAFDLKSTSARKNPEGVLTAFDHAGVAEAGGRLLLKVSGGEAEPKAFARLQARVRGRADVRLMTERLDGPDMRRLLASVDGVVSLHRSEGFGLVPAEALWFGKAVIATDWSATSEFLDATSAALVPYRLTTAGPDAGPYAGGRWAEPDVEAAAAHIRALTLDPARRATLGRRARARARAVFDEGAWLADVRARLNLAPADGLAPRGGLAPGGGGSA